MNIPNFIDMKVIDLKTGKFTSEWGVIMQQLLTQLQVNASDQGLVAPTQTDANVTIIQNAVNVKTVPPTPLCQFGTLLYDSTTNELKVALSNAGSPQFYTVVTI